MTTNITHLQDVQDHEDDLRMWRRHENETNRDETTMDGIVSLALVSNLLLVGATKRIPRFPSPGVAPPSSSSSSIVHDDSPRKEKRHDVGSGRARWCIHRSTKNQKTETKTRILSPP